MGWYVQMPTWPIQGKSQLMQGRTVQTMQNGYRLFSFDTYIIYYNLYLNGMVGYAGGVDLPLSN